ncbi:Hpt domain-containing protein [Tenacibaculum sp.]|uniref:Hpt domain-containing protein n=1 Tax=Tenacibaculum sp. TaxID=1906242 RepID=UPI003D149BB2
MLHNNCFNSEVVDLGFLNENLSGDVEQYSEMISIFLIQSKEKIATLKKAISEENFTLIKEASHFLRSSFTIMGLKSKNLLDEIETLSSELKDIEKIKTLTNSVLVNYDESVIEYEKILSCFVKNNN